MLVRDGFTGGLGANPVETVTHRTGLTALVLLLATLAVTPARELSGFGALAVLRRPLGLFAFAYAVLHVLTYAVDQTYLSGLGLSPQAIAEDIRTRPYITVGFSAFVLLVPLAVTSTTDWIKRLGAARWRRLHRLVYVAGVLVVLHFTWLVKADVLTPVLFGVVLGALLLYRLGSRRRARSRPAAIAAR
ncbi:MAG: sulfoxide reductase heme-binding subunit YedZ [Gemmatimonadales bacterium]|nr:sulfoxide reductase heme-binding subunit YedZ [Gemmatimonadales bacterium]